MKFSVKISKTLIAAAVISMTAACAKQSGTTTMIGEAPIPSSPQQAPTPSPISKEAGPDGVIPSIQGLPAIVHDVSQCPAVESGFYLKKDGTDQNVSTFAMIKTNERVSYRFVGKSFVADGRFHGDGEGPHYIAACNQGRLSVYLVQESEESGHYRLEGTLFLESQGSEVKAGTIQPGSSDSHSAIYVKKSDLPAIGEV